MRITGLMMDLNNRIYDVMEAAKRAVYQDISHLLPFSCPGFDYAAQGAIQQPGPSRHCSSLGSVGPRAGLAFRCGTRFSPYSPHPSKASSRRFQGHSPPQAFFGLFLCHVTLLSQVPSPHAHLTSANSCCNSVRVFQSAP